MKRKGHIFEDISSIKNLEEADRHARRGKLKQYGVQLHIKNEKQNLSDLRQTLLENSYVTSEYNIFKIMNPKERVISRLPYFPDRILHWAIYLQIEKIFVPTFTVDTYSSLKGRGVHRCSNNLKIALKDAENTKYCLKLDIHKFYPSINNQILKVKIRRKIKDIKALNLLDEIIDSAEGLPLGNLLSQLLSNIYLNELDHHIKANFKVSYFRYCDDIVVLSNSKKELHFIFNKIREILDSLNLKINKSHQVFPVASRGIDFVGFKHYHTHTLIRDSIKRQFIKAVRKHKNNKNQMNKIYASYKGWFMACDSINLTNKYY